MYKHILISTDGSETAQKGVDQGLALAKALGAQVTLITVTALATRPSGLHSGRRLLSALVVTALALVWLVLQHQTDLLGRSRRHEETDPEVARALREVRRQIDQGKGFPHR